MKLLIQSQTSTAALQIHFVVVIRVKEQLISQKYNQPIKSEHLNSISLHWRHDDHDGVSNHQPHGCLLNRLIGRRSKKTSKLRVTGRDRWIPAQKVSNAENVSIWWRQHVNIDCHAYNPGVFSNE